LKHPAQPFDFDQAINREQSCSVKFDRREAVFGRADVLPLWVADMDFAVPPAVTEALVARARHPVHGYSFFPDGLYQAMIDWFGKRHGWAIERDWILLVPGVVPSLHAACMAFAEAGEGVIVQSPVYPPFFAAPRHTGRRLLENPLVQVDGEYRMDLQHLRECAEQGARLLMLCSPHNPVGRVWRTEELEELLAIARAYGLVVLSDDIHCDLVFPGHHHQMLAQLARPGDQVITAVAPSKTFNIPGMGLSALVVPDAEHRRALKVAFESMHMEQANPFSIAAFEAAYRYGEPWLNALLVYLEDNARLVHDFLADKVPEISVRMPEGTYLMWLDCRKLGLNDAALKSFMIDQAGLGLNPGLSFGRTGSGHMRINIGTRRAVLLQALEQLAMAVRMHRGQAGSLD
jgi:cysteine-S-conjugate beta-lyase